MFFAVKSWKCFGLICLLLLEGVLRTDQLAWLVVVPAPQPAYRRKRGVVVYVGPVGWGGDAAWFAGAVVTHSEAYHL